MKQTIKAICVLALACGFVRADTLESVLARMDKAGPSFKALEANVTMLTYTAVIDDKAVETGKLKMQKLGPGNVRAIISFSGAEQERTIALLGKYAEIYYPASKTLRRMDLGNKGQVANQYLLLGFGSSGKELSQGYNLKLVGSDNVGGRVASKIELTPKDPDVKSQLSKVYLWIPEDAGYPVQQQLFDASAPDNYRKITYTNIVLNPPMNGELEFNPPKDTKIIRE